MDGLIHQSNHTYISTSVAQYPFRLLKSRKQIWQGALNWKQVKTCISFKRDVGIVWKNAEGIQKVRIKVISLVVTERIKGFSRDYRCAVINQWLDLVPLYAHAERSAVASDNAENVSVDQQSQLLRSACLRFQRPKRRPKRWPQQLNTNLHVEVLACGPSWLRKSLLFPAVLLVCWMGEVMMERDGDRRDGAKSSGERMRDYRQWFFFLSPFRRSDGGTTFDGAEWRAPKVRRGLPPLTHSTPTTSSSTNCFVGFFNNCS